MTALETQDLFGLSLGSLANESNGFLDSDTISVQNNGTRVLSYTYSSESQCIYIQQCV